MASTTNDYRLTNVVNEKNTAMNDMNNQYNQMINDSQGYYNSLINNSKDWTNKQQALQQQNTNFAIDKIEQEKQQSEKDYTKEQKGAYTDYQKAIDEYGVNAEKRASTGMNNTGYSETSQMTAFNAYQNRYASARETYNKAVLNYDNSIKEAILQNNSTLAQLAYEGLEKQLELSLQGFQYKNELIQQQFSNKLSLENLYETKYNNVLSQINTENALAEQQRQFNAQLSASKKSSSTTATLDGASSSSSSLNGSSSNDVSLTKITKTISRSNVLKGFTDKGYTLYADSEGHIFYETKDGETKYTGITNKKLV